jgi:Mg2+-importing ATPase
VNTDLETRPPSDTPRLTIADAAAAPVVEVLDRLGSSALGLSSAEARRRLDQFGPNAVRDHRARALGVLARQLKSSVLVLLLVTGTASFFLGQRTEAVIIGVILSASIGLGFVNEYRAERATQSLHSSVRHTTTALRDGTPVRVDVTALVPGDLVTLRLGEVVPADIRLLGTTELECDEHVLTGESLPVAKSADAIPKGRPLPELTSCALMGTVVHSGSASGTVVGTGARTAFGQIAIGLSERMPETEFQVGLRRFSMLLLEVATVLIVLIIAANLLLGRPLIEALLFSLAIAIGVTPQLLPAVVSSSLSTGSRRLAARKVLVKRLVCIEDLGEMDIFVTDKTGTLTEGQITLSAAVDPDGAPSAEAINLGLLTAAVDVEGGRATGGNALDVSLWNAASPDAIAGWQRLCDLPFDHNRARATTLVRTPDGQPLLVTKGAPEPILARCSAVPEGARQVLDQAFEAGRRVVAVATKSMHGRRTATVDDECDLTLRGFLIFLDPPKASAAAALARLASLGITVKIATGDNARVAQTLCAQLGLPVSGALTGEQVDALDDAGLEAAAGQTTIFARVTPEQKARIVRALRGHGRAVGFLGDGVNDALALHAADVGISVDSAADVARDAADVVLLEKSLDVLADGVVEGRRTFANTIKYVLMGTSSNFGNMVSAAAASTMLKFLPMLPSQILLNNLLYDSGQLTIPSDRVDEEQLTRPSHWDIGAIRRFMLVFGPLSSVFDFLTFAVLLGPLHATPKEFRTGWFVESLATQTLVIFAIRTRRVPFFHSRASKPLVISALLTVAVGLALPLSPFAGPLGFAAPTTAFLLTLAGLVVLYLALIEAGKTRFYRVHVPSAAAPLRRVPDSRVHRRAARFSVGGSLRR